MLVAAWRVLLISRVAAVLYDVAFVPAFAVVMLIADVLAIVAVVLSPKPILAIMGGLQQPPEDRLLLDLTMNVFVLGGYSLIVWFILALALASWARRRRADTEPADEPPATAASGVAGRRVAWAAVLAWLPVLIFTQAEQRLAWQVDRYLVMERFDDAFAVLKEHPQEAFPPHFDPRPRFWMNQRSPDLWRTMEGLVAASPAPWVHRLYIDKCRIDVNAAPHFRRYDAETIARMARVLPHLPEGPELASVAADKIARTGDLSSEESAAAYKVIAELATVEATSKAAGIP